MLARLRRRRPWRGCGGVPVRREPEQDRDDRQGDRRRRDAHDGDRRAPRRRDDLRPLVREQRVEGLGALLRRRGHRDPVRARERHRMARAGRERPFDRGRACGLRSSDAPTSGRTSTRPTSSPTRRCSWRTCAVADGSRSDGSRPTTCVRPARDHGACRGQQGVPQERPLGSRPRLPDRVVPRPRAPGRGGARPRSRASLARERSLSRGRRRVSRGPASAAQNSWPGTTESSGTNDDARPRRQEAR